MTHETSTVTVQVVVRNGQRYVRQCLQAIARQTYPHLRVLILDNNSTDETPAVVEREFPEFRLIRSETNLGMWPGQERLLSEDTSDYICCVSIDVIIADDFIERCVEAIRQRPSIAAVQGKLYQYSMPHDPQSHTLHTLEVRVIDTCGFAMTRSRKVINRGHGDLDGPAFARPSTVFGVEGAVPFFRRSSLQACAVEGTIWDADYFWYGDDLDLAWRMTLFGFEQVFEPRAVAWHDRSTTKGMAHTPFVDHLKRVRIRQQIPILKRRLDWSNTRFTIIKNDYIMTFLRDVPYIVAREFGVLAYTILFEPRVLFELARFLRLLPRMIHRRRIVMQRAQISSQTLTSWFHSCS